MRKRASVDDHSVGTLGRAVAASAQPKVPVWGIFVGLLLRANCSSVILTIPWLSSGNEPLHTSRLGLLSHFRIIQQLA